jgi:GAF domain-containing protein
VALLQRFEQASLRALDCERISIFLYDGARQQLCSRLATGVGELEVPVDCGIVGSSYRMRRVINVPDARADSRFYPAVDRISGFRTRSRVCVPPLNHDACPIGILEALNKRGAAFSAADEEVGVALGAIAGVALQRQALLEQRATREKVGRELGVAREIQRSLLPAAAPPLAGYDIAG